MYKLYYIWLVPAVFCLVYYVCCVAYAGFASSFITIWPVTAVFFAGIFAVRYAQNKGILILPMWINVLTAAGLLILISSFCLVQALITVQMKQKPEPDCEYLLILGCRVRGLEITKSLRYRLDAALAYLEQNEKHSKDNTQNKTIRIIVSGGQGPGEDISEAQAMKTYLTAAGIAADRILIEDRSTDTHENLLFSKQILEQQGLPNRITILTDGFHQYRAHRMATELGLESWSVSGKTRRILIPTYWVREWMALFEQFLGMA